MSTEAPWAGKGKAVSALFLLCFLWALDGLGPDLFPALRQVPMPAFERQAITCALLAVAAAAFAVRRRARWPDIRNAVVWAAVGLLMFVVPAIVAFAAQGWVPQLERVAIFSLTPVFAAVLEPHLGYAQQRNDRALLAALVAVAGAFCIFPLSVQGTPIAALAVLGVVAAVVCVAAGNCLAIQLACSQPDVSMATFAALASSASAAAFAVAGICTERAPWRLPLNGAQFIWLVAIDLPALVLLFWLFRRMSATQMTTRFLLAPWLIVLAGIALEQPAVTVRMILGVVLMAMGAGWLLLAPIPDAGEERVGIL
jgi:drug/metabolite transporter (DMT)-like permease